MLKFRYYLNQYLIEGRTDSTEWDNAVVEFVGNSHKLRMTGDVICFEFGNEPKPLTVSLHPIGDLLMLVKKLRVSLGHAGRDKDLKSAHSQFYNPKLARVVMQIVQEYNLCQFVCC